MQYIYTHTPVCIHTYTYAVHPCSKHFVGKPPAHEALLHCKIESALVLAVGRIQSQQSSRRQQYAYEQPLRLRSNSVQNQDNKAKYVHEEQ